MNFVLHWRKVKLDLISITQILSIFIKLSRDKKSLWGHLQSLYILKAAISDFCVMNMPRRNNKLILILRKTVNSYYLGWLVQPKFLLARPVNIHLYLKQVNAKS